MHDYHVSRLSQDRLATLRAEADRARLARGSSFTGQRHATLAAIRGAIAAMASRHLPAADRAHGAAARR